MQPPDPAGVSAEEARKALASWLVGKTLELDLLGPRPDRWGRFMGDLSVPQAESARSAAAFLLAAGLARVRPEFEAKACSGERLAIEDEARKAGLGLWRDPVFMPIPSSDVSALRQADARFVLVEGRVRRVGFGRSRIYLDLVPRDGPTIVVARRLEAALSRSGRPAQALVGSVIRARGVMDGRFGLKLEVADPAMIEIVRNPDGSEAAEARP